jgi:hypothetical protein|uniref:Uncharacterized protein n=1 Tax=Zea mays TaxID=4577 RepID=C0PD52_MAIZE|nr:unknown [Zea mays]
MYSLVAVDVGGDVVGQREAAVAGQLLRRGEHSVDLNVGRLEAPARGLPVGPGVRRRVQGPHAVAALVVALAGFGCLALQEGQARRQVVEHVGARDVGHRGLDCQHRHQEDDCNARASSLHGCAFLFQRDGWPGPG